MDRKEKPIPAKNIKEIINAFEEKSTTSPPQSKSPEKHGDRVKALENQLRTAIDNFSKGDICNIGSSSSTDRSEVSSIGEDAFSASKDDITKKFETYVRKVRVVSEPKKKYDAHLFTCCIVVGLCGKEPYIKSKYPPDVSKTFMISMLFHKLKMFLNPKYVFSMCRTNYCLRINLIIFSRLK